MQCRVLQYDVMYYNVLCGGVQWWVGPMEGGANGMCITEYCNKY